MKISEWAAQYRQKGWSICRLLPGGKDLKETGWTTKTAEPEDFQDNDNIGILTGLLSNNLVCIDLDSPEAVQRGGEFLPATAMIEGRKSKLRSHRYYVVTDTPSEFTAVCRTIQGGPRTVRFSTPEKVCVVELRGTGSQAAVPPSLHGSGELREWENGSIGAPASVPYVTLFNAVHELAKACGGQLPQWARPKTIRVPKQVRTKTPGGKPVENEERIVAGPVYLDGIEAIPMAERVKRCTDYTAPIEPAVSGKRGHDATYRFCCIGIRDFALDQAAFWPILSGWNARCQPPWTEHELQHKLDDVEDFEGEPRGGLLLEACRAFNDPERLAAGFRKQSEPLLFWRGQWYFWTEGHWRHREDEAMRADVRRYVAEAFVAFWRKAGAKGACHPVSERHVSETLAALRSNAILPGDIDPGTWLPDGSRPELLAVANGLLNLNTGELQLHSPDYFNLSVLPYPFDSHATCPKFTAAVTRVFSDDQSKRDLLQEVFGYCLCDDVAMQRFFLFTGDGSNGKSTIAAVLEAMIGEENTSELGLSDLAERFSLGSLIGKRLNVGSEFTEGGRLAEDRLKKLASGDGVSIDRKNLDVLPNVRLTAKLVFLTNQLPHFSDKFDGIWRRLVILPFTEKIREQEQKAGMDTVAYWATEAPGVLNWALEGRRRLLARGRFDPPASCREAVKRHRVECDPVALFVSECVRVQDDEWISRQSVFSHFKTWAADNQQGQRLSQIEFGRRFMRVVQCKEGRRRENGKTPHTYEGVALFRDVTAALPKKKTILEHACVN